MNTRILEAYESLPFWLRRLLSLLTYTARQFKRDQCMVSAGMLTYATLLSLVPFMIVVLSAFSSLPGIEGWNTQVQAFLLDNFLPDAKQAIEDTLVGLTSKRAGLTATMGLFLVVTSLILMSNIENALNRIWGVKTGRSVVSQFAVYWLVLTLGPVLLGASLALSSYFFSLEIVAEVQKLSVLRGLMETLTPLFVAAIAFFLLFLIVPNRQVPVRHAAVGALLTAGMFELAKFGFGFYIRNFDNYNVLYGALASMPIFLIWIYLSWSVILIGASLTAALDSFRFRSGPPTWTEDRSLLLLYRLTGHLWEAQKVGKGLTVIELLEREPDADDHQIQLLLENLRLANIVRRDDKDEWILARDLADLSLGELYGTGCYVWPFVDGGDQDGVNAEDPWNRNLKTGLHAMSRSSSQILDRSLKSFYAGPGLNSEDESIGLASGEQ
jgi:membrane protein